MPGAAAQIAYVASTSSLSGKAIEQRSIDRLILEFGEDSARILLRKPIIGCANAFASVVPHMASVKIMLLNSLQSHNDRLLATQIIHLCT
jgi:hypothetical protein